LSVGVSYTSCSRFLTSVSLNCWYHNGEPQEARIMRHLRTVSTRVLKNSLLVHFQVCLLIVFVMQLDLSTHQMCLLQDCSMVNFTAFTWSSQKLPSVGGECISIYIYLFIFCSSFHTMAGKYPLLWSLYDPASVSFSVQNSSASLFFLV
jgi:hypothetical protein